MRAASCGVLLWVAVAAAVLVSAAFGHEGLHEKIASVTQRIEKQGGQAQDYLARAELYRLHRDLQAARRDLEQVARIRPGLPELAFARARLEFDAADFAVARASSDEFLRTSPEHSGALFLRARSAARLGDHEAAALDFDRSIACSRPPRPEHYLERARSMRALNHDDGDVLLGLDEGIATLGMVPSLCDLTIELEVEGGRFDAALKRLQTVSATSTRQEQFHARRGDILRLAGRTDEARAEYRAALKAITRLPVRHLRTKAMAELRAGVERRLQELALPTTDSSGESLPESRR